MIRLPRNVLSSDESRVRQWLAVHTGHLVYLLDGRPAPGYRCASCNKNCTFKKK